MSAPRRFRRDFARDAHHSLCPQSQGKSEYRDESTSLCHCVDLDLADYESECERRADEFREEWPRKNYLSEQE